MSNPVCNTARKTANKAVPLRPVQLGQLDAVLERNSDGTIYMRVTQQLPAYPDRFTEWLDHWAKAAPNRIFLAQREAFDDEGFYKLGDTLKFADPDNPGGGLLFEGRIAEDYKLSTGTWVKIGPLRTRFIDYFAPHVRDVVFAGADRDDIAVLVFPDIEACRKLCPYLPPGALPAAVLADLRVRQHFAGRLDMLAAQSQGSSTRICRAILVETPPSMDAGEMIDKGTINQRAVLKNRTALVDELYTQPISARVLAIEG